jgi:hypothetical protein
MLNPLLKFMRRRYPTGDRVGNRIHWIDDGVMTEEKWQENGEKVNEVT